MSTSDKPLDLDSIEELLRQLETIRPTGDYRLDQAFGLAHDRLLMMWAEARREAPEEPEAHPLRMIHNWEQGE